MRPSFDDLGDYASEFGPCLDANDRARGKRRCRHCLCHRLWSRGFARGSEDRKGMGPGVGEAVRLWASGQEDLGQEGQSV